MKFDYGLVSVSFRQLNPIEIITYCKNAGLTCIEWGSDVHAPHSQIDALNELAILQQKHGVRCCSYGTYFRIGVNNSDELNSYINAAKILGTNVLRVWCGNKSFAEFSNLEKENFINECKAIAHIAENNNVIVCMECHNGTFTDSVDGALYLMNHVDSPNFQMYWQPNQFITFNDNNEYANRISQYTKRIHVFYWTKDRMYPLSKGKKEWVQYLKNFKTDIPLLLEFMPDGKPETVFTEAKTLFEIGEEVKNEFDR